MTNETIKEKTIDELIAEKCKGLDADIAAIVEEKMRADYAREQRAKAHERANAKKAFKEDYLAGVNELAETFKCVLDVELESGSGKALAYATMSGFIFAKLEKLGYVDKNATDAEIAAEVTDNDGE